MQLTGEEMPTELFEDIFHSGSSGCIRTCDCGRTYFDEYDTTVDWAEGELEDLQEKAKDNPEKFIPGDFSIPTLSIAGREFVLGCLCNESQKYEDFINNHDRQIAKYLNKKAEDLKTKSNEIKVR